MAYFLGYRRYNKYIPINLVDENGNKISNDILDIIKFTNSFISESSLKNYLIDKLIIDSSKYELMYLIEKGKKDNKTYEPIKLGNKIYYSDSSKYFKPNYLKSYLLDKKYDYDFIIHIYSYYLKKFGFLGKIQEKFIQDSSNILKLKNILNNLLEKELSSNIKRIVNKIIELIDDTYDQDSNTVREFTQNEYIAYSNFIDELYYAMHSNDEDLVIIYYYMLNKISFPNIPTINYLKNIYSIIKSITEIGEENYSYFLDDRRDINSEWISLFNSIVYIYDKHKREYKKNGTNLKIQNRNLVDLGMFIYNYEEYLKIINKRNIQYVEETCEENEEFLEEEDFERYNTTAEDEGYSLRMSDSKRGYHYE